MEHSESIKEIATALCKFHAQVGKVKKDSKNPFFKSSYASLSSILDVVDEPLHTNGLSVVQFPTGQHELVTMILHVSGEWMRDSYDMKPTKNDPQGLGSVITYQRRYALGAVLGLNIDDDDDGNKGSEPPKKPSKKEIEEKAIKAFEEAMELMVGAKDMEKLKALWSHYKVYQEDKRFADAKEKRKEELTK